MNVSVKIGAFHDPPESSAVSRFHSTYRYMFVCVDFVDGRGVKWSTQLNVSSM